MDETRIVREAYGQPAPPTPDEIARARALLDRGSDRLDFAGPVGEATDDVQVITVGPTDEPTPGRRRRFGWRAQAGLGMVAAAAAAVTGIVLLGGAPAEPDRGPAGGPGAQAGRDLLLAVAARAERLPATRGRYWYTSMVSGQSYIIRAKTGEYAIVGAHTEYFKWLGAKKGDGTGSYGRHLPARPLTAADEAGWRRAGSPAMFRVWSNDHFQIYGRRATPWRADDPDPRGGGSFSVRGRTMTTRQVRELSPEPAKLAELLRDSKPWPPPPGRRPGDGVDSAARHVVGLLNIPVSPQVRAGLLRALAAQPDARVVGEKTDPLGRRGVAVTIDTPQRKRDVPLPTFSNEPEAEKGDFGSRGEIIIDPQTGEVLSDQSVLTKPGGPYRMQKPGFVIDYWATRDAGWTDSQPKPLVELPF
ncbi:CU044_5270 family protein [Actinomadura sp. 6N118]|uniref:CU044_5270 family protein n=1 Tax=Actinomadura sp. 6N118 TaxID=3375151 RepID=UPI00379D87A5